MAGAGAIMQMTRCAALDSAKWGVRVNAVCPGASLFGTLLLKEHIHYLCPLTGAPAKWRWLSGRSSVCQRYREAGLHSNSFQLAVLYWTRHLHLSHVLRQHVSYMGRQGATGMVMLRRPHLDGGHR